MSLDHNLASIIILASTIITSLLALYTSPRLLERCLFRPYVLLRESRFDTLYMSGFVHASLGHLALNMISFWFFGPALERRIGTTAFIVLYALGLVGSQLPSWLRHRDDPQYASLGASGAVMAVIFASVVYFPDNSLFILPIPIPIPAPLFAVGYTAWSWYASRHARDNINHDAHLAGSLLGIAFVAITDWTALARFAGWVIRWLGLG